MASRSAFISKVSSPSVVRLGVSSLVNRLSQRGTDVNYMFLDCFLCILLFQFFEITQAVVIAFSFSTKSLYF